MSLACCVCSPSLFVMFVWVGYSVDREVYSGPDASIDSEAYMCQNDLDNMDKASQD